MLNLFASSSSRQSLARTVLAGMAAVGVTLGAAAPADAAGTLTPVHSPDQPIAIRSHNVKVTINNGFARTEVEQVFFNPNATKLEAIYAFPVPKSASLSEMSILSGEIELLGEVVAKPEAERIYAEEKAQGNDAGIARKESFQTFEFLVANVMPSAETRMRFVYYQPLEIDTGVGRYVYPLEDGGTDEKAQGFWSRNEKVDGQVTIDVDVRTALPIEELRAPGFETAATIDRVAEDHHRLHLDATGASLNRDFVLYYRLPTNLPGRVEVLSYRPDATKPGTFMAVVTPGIDLQPITTGADWCFVLDVSGSMQGKIRTLADGVSGALGQLNARDRFRVITFNDSAREIVPVQAATPENVKAAIERVRGLATGGSTNLYGGVQLSLNRLDADRATSVILVTDGVTNTGVVEPRAFHTLLGTCDIRFFGFLMGNGANWPLMRTICDASGGFYAGVSNEDDIIGQILLAKSKVTHECLHDASLTISGVPTHDCTDELLGKVYRGQQVVFFGKYDQAGEATLTLKANLTGEDKTYTTRFAFPEVSTEYPEIERLAALQRIEELEVKELAGLMDSEESKATITQLGIDYQLVTDHTSMIVLSEEAHQRHGITRSNRDRVERERTAQTQRAAQPVVNHRVDAAQPMFNQPAPTVSGPSSSGSQSGGGGGGGALDPLSALLALGVGAVVAATARRRRNSQTASAAGGGL